MKKIKKRTETGTEQTREPSSERLTAKKVVVEKTRRLGDANGLDIHGINHRYASSNVSILRFGLVSLLKAQEASTLPFGGPRAAKHDRHTHSRQTRRAPWQTQSERAESGRSGEGLELRGHGLLLGNAHTCQARRANSGRVQTGSYLASSVVTTCHRPARAQPCQAASQSAPGSAWAI